MKIAIVGMGVIGSVLGACLRDSGEEVILVDVDRKRLEELRATGLRVHDPNNVLRGDFSVIVESVRTSLEELADAPPEAVFVCVKTCVMSRLIPALKTLHGKGASIISFQNGLDVEELVAREIGTPERVFRVVVNYAGKVLEDGRAALGFFVRPNYIGAATGGDPRAAGPLAELLNKAGLETEATDKIKTYVWEKVILNSALSSVCALTGQTMRDAMEHPDVCRIIEGVVREGIAVAEAGGIEFQNGFFDHCMGYLKKGGKHKPSMLIDVEAGRATEIDFLNGMISRRGEESGVAVPHNRTIAALVKGVEASILEERKK